MASLANPQLNVGTKEQELNYNLDITFRLDGAVVKSILLNIMFHALMGRFQLELFIFITYFSTVVPFTSCVFFHC